METAIDCAKDCINGCVLGEKCPNLKYAEQANQFMQETSLDKMHEIAHIARLKKLREPPKWVIPEDF